MPYIPQIDRAETLSFAMVNRARIGETMGKACRNGGDLQYMLAVAINTYMETKGLRYQNCQDILGALEGAKQEFYRVVVGPYEEKKIQENGGVYTVTERLGDGY